MGRTWEQVKVPGEDVFPPSAPPLGSLFAASPSFADTPERHTDTLLSCSLAWLICYLTLRSMFIALLSDPLKETLGSGRNCVKCHIFCA